MCCSTWGMNNYFPEWSKRGLLYFSIRKEILAFSPVTGRAILHYWRCMETCISLGASSAPSASWACPGSLSFSPNALHEREMALAVSEAEQGKTRALAHVPALSAKMIQGGWSSALQGRGCHSFLRLFQPWLFCLVLHTGQNRKLSLPTWAEGTNQNLWNSRQESEIPPFHCIWICHFKMCCCFSPSSFLCC